MKFIHIAGTNGKEITNEEMSELIEELKPKIENYNETKKVNITLFELETTIALLYFYRKKVDFVVLEIGLGGLYDCTNVITNPLVSVITSIGYDHMHILGNTLEEIAYQKAGIIKPNSSTVFFEQSEEINNVFIDICNARMEVLNKNPLIIYDGAHNEPAVENLQGMVNMYYKNVNRQYIVSILERKDYDKMIKLLLEDEKANFIFTSGNDPERFASKQELYDVALKYKNNQQIEMMDLEEAIEYISKEKNNHANFIVGSFYIYGSVLNKIKSMKHILMRDLCSEMGIELKKLSNNWVDGGYDVIKEIYRKSLEAMFQ